MLKISKRIFIRTLASALSASILASSVNFNVSAENKVRTFAKNHPIINSGVATAGGITLLTGLTLGIVQLSKMIKNSQVHTLVDNIPEAEIQNYLNEQIEEFENYGKDGSQNLFTVSGRIRNEASPRVLALIIKSINIIFEKDAFFLNALKAKLKRDNHTFQIDWGEDDMYHELFCTLSTLDYFGKPYILKINKMYGKSFNQAKRFMPNHQSLQRIVVWSMGYFFNEYIINKSQQLTIDRVFEFAQTKNPAFNKNNKQFSKEALMRCNPNPFADLLSDYVLEEYPENDIFVEIFRDYLNSLKANMVSI